MKKVPNEEDPRILRRLLAAVTGEGNEGEEGDVAVDEATIRLMVEMLKGQIKLPLTKFTSDSDGYLTRLCTRANLLLSRQPFLLLSSHRRTYHSTQCPNLTPSSRQPEPGKQSVQKSSSYKNPR